MLAEVETRRNGTGAVRMPIKQVVIALDEIGYPGWAVTMRTNPRSSVYDRLIKFDDDGDWWTAFGQIVLEWNLADEDERPLLAPREYKTERDLDLPPGVVAYIFGKYIEAFVAATAFPKAPSASSAATSSTSDESQESA